MKVRNTFIIFLVSGFWHGANWTFIVWGGLNALYFLPYLLMNRNRNNLGIVAEGKLLPSIKELAGMTLTFWLTVVAWIFFRAENLGQAGSILIEIASPSLLSVPGVLPKVPLLLIAIFLVVEWLGRAHPFAIAEMGKNWKAPLRWAFYLAITITILAFSGNQQEFIYFQF